MITRKPALVVSIILALCATPAIQRADTAPALTIEERLAKLEAEIISLKQENQQLRTQIGVAIAHTGATDASAAPSAAATINANEAAETAKKNAESPTASRNTAADLATPAPATPVPSIIKPGGGEQVISVGGFIMAQAEAGNAIDSRFANATANDRFYLRRARIVLGGHFAEDFDFKISAELAGSLSNNNGMRGQLADGYISWTKYPALNATIGQFKTNYGHEFLSNDLTVYTIEHALVTDLLTLGRQIGAQASGTFLKTRLNYAIGIFNGNGVNSNGINTTVNDNNQFLYAGRVTLVPVKTKIASLDWDALWNIGVNAYRSNDSCLTLPDGTSGFACSQRRIGWGVDTQLTIGPWTLWAEYLTTEFTPENPTPAQPKFTADGWFIQAAWNIVPKKWQTVIRYDTFDPNTDIAGNQTNAWTFGVNYLIKGDDLKLMLDYMTSDPRLRANNYKDEGRADRVLLRMQAVF